MPEAAELTFSVVIPLYNKRDSVRAAVNSVLGQKHQQWELIIVDDGSTDGGLQALEDFTDPRIRRLIQPNAGVSAARNRALEAARHEWVALLDADDLWMPNHLSDLAAVIDEGVTLVASAYFVQPETGPRRLVRVPDRAVSAAGRLRDFFALVAVGPMPIQSSAACFPRSALLQWGGFPVGVRSGEDLLTWARLACMGDVAYASAPSVVYFQPSMRAATRVSAIRRPQVPDKVGEELGALIRRFGQDRPSLKGFLGAWRRIRATLFTELGEGKAAISELRLAVESSGPRMRDIAFVLLLALPGAARRRLLAWKRAGVSGWFAGG